MPEDDEDRSDEYTGVMLNGEPVEPATDEEFEGL